MSERRIDRRTFLKGGLLASGLLAGGGAAVAELTTGDDGRAPAPRARRAVGRHDRGAPPPADPPPPTARRPRAGEDRPNILVVLVDQLRAPQWSTAGAAAAR